MTATRNVYVDDGEGRTYRVCYPPPAEAKPFVVRRSHGGYDVGLPLKPDSAKARRLFKIAEAQTRGDQQ